MARQMVCKMDVYVQKLGIPDGSSRQFVMLGSSGPFVAAGHSTSTNVHCQEHGTLPPQFVARVRSKPAENQETIGHMGEPVSQQTCCKSFGFYHWDLHKTLCTI